MGYVRKIVTPDLEKSFRKKTDGQMKKIIDSNRQPQSSNNNHPTLEKPQRSTQ